MLLSQSGWKEPVFTLATSVSTLSRKRQREVRKAVTSCIREHGVVFLTASFEDSDSTASSMFFEDIFPAFFQYASGEDCFESDEYIHEALFLDLTNYKYTTWKSVCQERRQINQTRVQDMTEPDTMTYIRAGSCVRTCSSMCIYVWPDATVCVVRCVRTH